MGERFARGRLSSREVLGSTQPVVGLSRPPVRQIRQIDGQTTRRSIYHIHDFSMANASLPISMHTMMLGVGFDQPETLRIRITTGYNKTMN